MSFAYKNYSKIDNFVIYYNRIEKERCIDMQRLTSLKEIETALNQYGEIVVSKNNKNNVVVMSMEEYKKKMLDEEIERKILKSEEDYNNRRVRKAEDVFKEWKLKYGI